MRKSHDMEEQIALALKQAKLGTAVAEVCRKMGLSEATFFAGSRNTLAWAPRSSGRCGSSTRRTPS